MERGNSTHGAHVDEQMKAEVKGYVQGAPASTRAEEWHDPEAPGEDQPEVSGIPDLDAGRPGGAPPGITAAEAEWRSRLGRHLPRTIFPADASALRGAAASSHAPDDIIDLLGRLPDRKFGNVAEVWTALGGGAERRW